MYINMSPKDIPYWNPNLPYWEQSVEALLFWENEYDKIRNGVNLGGYYMNGWMYFHLNHFTADVFDLSTDSPVIRQPFFDDNVYFLMECFNKAVKEGKGFVMWGTRGFAKTTFMASHEYWTHLCRNNSGATSLVVYGGSEDVSAMESSFSGAHTRMHSAFRLNIPSGQSSWDKASEVSFGYTLTNSEKLISSRLKLINGQKGVKSASEKTAGYTPIGFKMDEIGKFDPIGVFQAAQVSFKRSGVATFTFILSGTGGNSELSEGAKKMLTNPNDYDISIMNWDLLNNMVPEEHITWKEDTGRLFSTFVPGHMSYRNNQRKDIITFGEFSKFKYKSEELNSMVFNTTNWGKANEFFYNTYNSYTDNESKNKLRMYLPRNISDTFLVDNTNSFDKDKIVQKLEEIKRQPKYELVDFEVDYQGKITKKFVDKPLAGRRYEGKYVEAPYMIFEGFPDEIPGKFHNVSGCDDYKSEDSTTDSLGSMYVLSRRSSTEPLEKIIASITERPKRHRHLYEHWEKLIRATNALCNIEIADANFVPYLEDTLKVNPGYYLHPFINPHEEQNTKRKSGSTSKYRYGVYPTTQNKSIMIQEVIDYTQTEFNAGFDAVSNMPIVKCGIDLIEDPWLLQEMLEYQPGSNVDRIVSFGWALVLARYMDRKKLVKEDLHVKKYNENAIHTKPKVKGIYGSTKRIRNF